MTSPISPTAGEPVTPPPECPFWEPLLLNERPTDGSLYISCGKPNGNGRYLSFNIECDAQEATYIVESVNARLSAPPPAPSCPTEQGELEKRLINVLTREDGGRWLLCKEDRMALTDAITALSRQPAPSADVGQTQVVELEARIERQRDALTVRNEQFDKACQRIAELEAEVARLKTQLGSCGEIISRQGAKLSRQAAQLRAAPSAVAKDRAEVERSPAATFRRGTDPKGNDCFYWSNPYNGKDELVAMLFWPAHPVEATKAVEELYESLELRVKVASEDSNGKLVAELTGLNHHLGGNQALTDTISLLSQPAVAQTEAGNDMTTAGTNE